MLVSGYGLNGKENVVIVELKQWEKLTAIDGQDAIVETYTVERTEELYIHVIKPGLTQR